MKKIYEKIYRKIKIKFLARIIAIIYYFLVWIRYQLGKVRRKTTSSINEKEAFERINEIYNVPNRAGEEYKQSKDIKICYDLSIVIPAYNVEKYIEECLDSILTQNTKYKVEVIVVNDGSTDNTAGKLERYSQDDNVVIITQENQGISVARNQGIDIARGEYIMFVDSDDRLAEGAIDAMLNCAKESKADIVQGGYIRFSTNNKYYQKFEVNYERDIKSTAKFYMYQGYPWGKIFRRELWEKVRFPQGFWFEDTVIKLVLYGLADVITVCDELVYEYRANDSGISARAKKKEKSLDAFFVIEKILNCAKVNQIQLEEQSVFYEWFLKEQITGLLWNRIQFMSEEVKECIFVLIAEMIVKNGIEYKGNDKMTINIYKAIHQREYISWKNCARYMSYQV